MKNDGGEAFPVSPEESKGKVSSVHGGMSLRAWFAGKAMEGFCLGANADYGTGKCNGEIIDRSVLLADLMIEKLNQDAMPAERTKGERQQ